MAYPRLDGTGLTTLLTRLAAVIKQGHTVVDSTGTALTQRDKLKFVNATVTDDSTNNVTVVTVQGGGGGGGNVEVMDATDVDDIKDAVSIDCMDAVEVMTSSDVEDIKDAFEVDSSYGGVRSFNGRSGSILPMAGDYTDAQITLTTTMHIGGGTQDTVEEALIALNGGENRNLRSASNDSLYEVAEQTSNNSDALYELAERIADLEDRVTALEEGNNAQNVR